MTNGRGIVIEAFDIERYDDAIALWKRTPGMGLSSADERAALASFLDRNPGMSFVALVDGVLVGTALCGTDGRRGYLYHVAVDPDYRHGGLGSTLAARALDALAAVGIHKCHLFVMADNSIGVSFWAATGWTRREDIVTFSKDTR
jgi:ribosomal protein S18 acetylase RimI-like enzyme